MKIGFIGLGIMGAPMALHLVDAGHQLFVKSGRKIPESIAATSAIACADPAEVTRQAEVVFLDAAGHARRRVGAVRRGRRRLGAAGRRERRAQGRSST